MYIYLYVYKLKICREKLLVKCYYQKVPFDSANNQKPNLVLKPKESVDTTCVVLLTKLTSTIEVVHDHVRIPVVHIQN